MLRLDARWKCLYSLTFQKVVFPSGRRNERYWPLIFQVQGQSCTNHITNIIREGKERRLFYIIEISSLASLTPGAERNKELNEPLLWLVPLIRRLLCRRPSPPRPVCGSHRLREAGELWGQPACGSGGGGHREKWVWWVLQDVQFTCFIISVMVWIQRTAVDMSNGETSWLRRFTRWNHYRRTDACWNHRNLCFHLPVKKNLWERRKSSWKVF